MGEIRAGEIGAGDVDKSYEFGKLPSKRMRWWKLDVSIQQRARRFEAVSQSLCSTSLCDLHPSSSSSRVAS